MITLFDDQKEVVSGVQNLYRAGHKEVCLVLPTGGGKTVCASYITSSAVGKGTRILIIVHRIELLRQWQQALLMFDIRAGLIAPKYTPDFRASVQICMVQSMTKAIPMYPKFDFVITDEAHHILAKTYMDVIAAYTGCYQLGLTATPIRLDGKPLGDVFTGMHIGKTTSELIALDRLTKPRIFRPELEIDMSSVPLLAGEFNKKAADEIVMNRQAVGSVVDSYLFHAKNKPGVIFTSSVSHAVQLAKAFQDAGVKKAFSVDGKTDPELRRRILDGLGNGDTEVALSCNVISEGTDIPSIFYGADAAPTMSLSRYLQQFGRVLRKAKGKDSAIWVDHVGNLYRHGHPLKEREWDLTKGVDKPKKEGDKLIKYYTCDSCYQTHDKPMKVCVYCGAAKEIKPRENIKEVDGVLVEVTEEELNLAKKNARKEVGMVKSLDDLKRIAAERGYKRGWVYQQAKIKGISA